MTRISPTATEYKKLEPDFVGTYTVNQTGTGVILDTLPTSDAARVRKLDALMIGGGYRLPIYYASTSDRFNVYVQESTGRIFCIVSSGYTPPVTVKLYIWYEH